MKNRFLKKISWAIKTLLFWLPAVLYMTLIFHLSSAPPPETARAFPVFFEIKVLHIIEYAGLASLIFFAVHATTKLTFKWEAVYSIMSTYIYGLSDELHQVFVPGRSASLLDASTNLMAACLAMAAIYYLRRKILGRNT